MTTELFEHYQAEVVKGVRSLVEKGLLAQETGGNVSVRIPEPDGLAITPSQTPYGEMTPGDICLLGPDLSPLVQNNRKPSIEAGMHLLVYRQRPDVQAVAHTHQRFASIFALINRPIPPLFDEVSLFIGNRVEVVPYGFSGSRQLIDNLAPLLDNRANCYILQNHGALNLGTNMEKAVRNATLLEKSAEIYYRALATGLPVHELPADTQTLLAALLAEEQQKATS
jgi:ribulose-5-phosphate 4-epimerase/fuculose-1-phosphate aldolase